MAQRRVLKRLASIALIALLLTTMGSASIDATTGAGVLPPHLPGELLVKLRPGAALIGDAATGAPGLAAIAERYGVLDAAPLFPDAAPSPAGLERIYRLTLPADTDLLSAIEAFTADPGVEYAEPNYVFQLGQGGTNPQQQPAARHDPGVDELLQEARTHGTVSVIVGVAAPAAPAGWADNPQLEAAHRAAVSQAQQAVLQQLAGTPVQEQRRYQYIPYMALLVDEPTLQVLAAMPEITSIEPNLALSLQLADSLPLIGITPALQQDHTGAGWTVAVLDTGVDNQHPFLKDKVIAGGCFSTQDTQGGVVYSSLCTLPNVTEPITSSTELDSGRYCDLTLSGCDHGTHVAGIVAGKAYNNMPGGPFSGVASEASLIAVKVFSRTDDETACGVRPAPCSKALNSDIIAGLEYVFSLRADWNIAAVNLSLGSAQVYDDTAECDAAWPAVKAVIDDLRGVGIATVIASGNGDANNIGHKNGISFPACISSAISVGATTKDDQVASFSNSVSWLNLLAPGAAINSSIPLTSQNGSNPFAEKSGTSMAAPHVAGAWALLRQTAPLASVEQVLDALTSTGTPVSDNRPGGDQLDRPRINVASALRSVQGGVTISDGPLYNFGAHRADTVTNKAFTISNTGRFDALIEPDANAPAGAFRYAGGAYPGTGGTCHSLLVIGGSCTVVVSFSPEARSPSTSQLRLSYVAPLMNAGSYEAAITLAGTGTDAPRLPDDPFFGQQYGLHNTGQDGGADDADIDAPEGWGISTGSAAVLVAVIDSGIDYEHEDLDDGRVRTDIGWDYVHNERDALDDNGHGTHVAGIIAAETNNGAGTAGVMWQAELLPLKVCNERGSCNTDSIAAAIRYAADQGARVINMSLGGACASTIADAVNYAHFEKGVVIVAAAGNEGGSVSFPAAFDPVIAVGAVDKFGALTSFSNRGPQQDVTAPGLNIWSTVPGNDYEDFSGTSMASPFVAGVAGALIAQRPDLSNEQVRDILRLSADDLGDAGRDDHFGYGRVNLYAALQQPSPTDPAPSTRAEQCSVCGASSAAAEGSDGAGLLSNLRALRDTVFSSDPGRRWARIYYEHQFEVALMVATDGALRGEVLAGWREFDPVFQRLMDEGAPPVVLTPELIAVAERVMLGVAERGSPAVHAVIDAEWQRVNPERFIGREVRDIWAQLVAENQQQRVYLPMLMQ